MKYLVKSGLAAGFVLAAMSFDAPEAEAGLFKKLFAKKAASCCEPEPTCCEPEPTCCEPAPEPECCPEPAPEPVCCPEPAPEPVCCEPAPEPECTPEPAPCCEAEPAPEPCCASIHSLPTLAKGEVLISISPITMPVSGVAVTSKATAVAATTLVSVKR